MMTRMLICAAAILALPVAPAAAGPGNSDRAGMARTGQASHPILRLARGPDWKNEERGRRRGRHDAEDDDRGPPGFRKGKGRHGRKERGRGGKHRAEKFRFRGKGPPPWAPAHGWRRSHGGYSGYRTHRDSTTVSYVPPFEIARGVCNRQALGTALGGLAGALVGSRLSRDASRTDRTAAVLGGTIFGALVGGSVGRSMDQVDQNCIGQALEHARDNQPVSWRTDAGAQYEVKPTGTYRDQAERYCREYQTTIIVGGQPQQAYGKACRQPDGSWEKVS